MDRAQSLHALKIREMFSGNVAFNCSKSACNKSKLEDLIIVHFTNRSGSHFLCDLLAKAAGLRLLNEALNWDTVQSKSNERGVTCLSDYVSEYLCETPSIVKVNTDQLYMLTNWGYLTPCSQKISENKKHLISIQRNDVISQAVSFAIALQTKKFTSLQNASVTDEGIEFKPEMITGMLQAFGKENQDYLVISSALCHKPLRVIYEELVEEPNTVIASVCSLSGLFFIKLTLNQAIRSKQVK